MDWHQEGFTAVSLFLTIVISNFLARVVLRRTGWRFLGLDHQDGALCVTILAVAVEAAWLGWGASTILSIITGFVFAFLWARLPQKEQS
jgi:hypothetical protein